MIKKNTLTAALSAVLAAATLLLWQNGASSGETPPLEGVFKDNFTLLDQPVPAPQGTITDGAGRSLDLSEFAGRVVLVNFWATWCAPCIREMPSLDRLQMALGHEGLNVVSVSQDRGGAKVVLPFFQELGLHNLQVYLDPKARFAREFGVRGLPTSYLIDRAGYLVGAMEGPAEWDSPEAQALIGHYLRAGPSNGGNEGKAKPIQTGG